MKAIRCKCGCIYPDDMDKCPTCHCETRLNGDHVLTGSKELGSRNTESSAWIPVKTKSVYSQRSNYARENNQSSNTRLVVCVACNAKISSCAESCPHCGHPTGVHICPKCNSTNTKTISGASKATSIFLWGPFAANKVLSKFQCKDCGHKW